MPTVGDHLPVVLEIDTREACIATMVLPAPKLRRWSLPESDLVAFNEASRAGLADAPVTASTFQSALASVAALWQSIATVDTYAHRWLAPCEKELVAAWS